MPRRPIFTDVMDVLERRILEGDYMLKDLPGERKLAEEVGVSYMTARKAVLGLIEKNVLTRKPNGSLAIHPRYQEKKTRCQVALLTPAYPSAHFMHCRLAISRAAEKHNVQFRPVEYMHWYDPAVNEALQGSDGLLIIPSTEPLPEKVLKELASPDQKVVFFDDDMTEHGIPSIRLFAREHISQLFEYLWSLGHRKLHCLNAQGHNPEIDRRIHHWQSWLEEHDGEGVLWDEPAPPYEDVISRAYQTMRKIVSEDREIHDAIVCTTQPAALGAIRACYEKGLHIGEDVSICTINNEPTGRFYCPTLTGLEMPDIEDLMSHCFSWFADSEASWSGPLRAVPEQVLLFKGESTGKAIVTA